MTDEYMYVVENTAIVHSSIHTFLLLGAIAVVVGYGM